MESCADLGGVPDVRAAAITDWQTLAGWLLTREGEWRKSFAERDGFPPKSNGAGARERELFKTRMTTLVDGCAAVPGLREFARLCCELLWTLWTAFNRKP